MQKAIEEAKKFVCTTKDRIVKDTKEFIQNVDWKKVAIGVAGTLAVAAVVVATGGAAAPVLIGAAVGAGIGTGTTIVSGVIQGKSPAEIAQDASGAFMWGAIGGAVGGGTAQIGTKALGKVGKKLVEDGVDMAVDLTQTATENGGLTGKDILFSAVTSCGGDLFSSVKTNSTTRNQLVDGITDNRSVKNAVEDSVSDVRYGPMNPGPLTDDVANNFRSSSYTGKVLTEDTTFYRTYTDYKVGNYMTRTPQNGNMQSQMDLALNPDWGNMADNVTTVTVPKGTTIYEGVAAPQTINEGAGQLLGGGNQVYVPGVDPSWIGN